MSKSNRKAKWKNITITVANVDEYLNDLYHDTKGQYINMGVSFNKDDDYQLTLLKFALLEPHAFSGLCKKLLANYFGNKEQQSGVPINLFDAKPIIQKREVTPSVPKPYSDVNQSPSVQQDENPVASTAPEPISADGVKKRRSGSSSLGVMLLPNPDAKTN